MAAKVDRPWSWEFYNTLAESLAPKSPGKKEAELIFQKLSDDISINRKELINFLITTEGQQALKSESEMEFHNQFLLKANEAKSIILAIQAYERVSRFLFNAFYESMRRMSKNQNKGSLKELSMLTHVQRAFKDLSDAFKKLEEKLEPFPQIAIESSEKFL